MSYYLVAIGGIGSKCVEAFTHLCAAGFLPRGEEINVLAVDPDTGNGNLKRAGGLISFYRSLQELDFGDTELFSAKISHGDPFYWSPVAGNATLDSIFGYYRMKGGKDEPAAKLYDVLFSRAEGGQNLNEGYRGHPSIGAAVMAQRINFGKVSSGEMEEGADLGNERVWSDIYSKMRSELKNGDKVNIFLFASVFGGTGASGFSTIATLFKKKFDDFFQQGSLRIGGALLLPYFSFPDEEDGAKEIFAASANFLTNTQVALKYYSEKAGFEGIYKELYLIGDSYTQTVKDFCKGGAKQENEANLVELYAAFAASAFFKKKDFSENTTVYMCARENEDKVRWGDLPKGEEAKQKIGRLSRFLFAYTLLIRPTLKEIAATNSGVANAPWYVDFFLKEEVSLKQAEPYLLALDKYTTRFFEWLSQTHAVYSGRRVELTQSKAYQDLENLKYQSFPELIMDVHKEEQLKTGKVWDRLCGAKVKDKHASGLGKFLRALYDSVQAE